MATYAFSGGTAEIKGAGQRSKLRFNGTWVAGDSWTVGVTSQLSGDFTLGKGEIAGKDYTAVLNFKNRSLLGYMGGFSISAVNDPTGWEEQNVGTASFVFSTTYGISDTVYGFSSIGGLVYVFGQKTIQSWATDADPSKWTLVQVIDNAGTAFVDSIQSLGEIDVLYVDRTGIRSIRTKELSGAAFISDVGTPVDELTQVRVRQAEANNVKIVATINPVNKNYMAFIYDSIFTLSQYSSSKLSAWTRYDTSWTDVLNALSNIGAFNGSGVRSITGLTIGRVYHWTKGVNTTSLVNGTETFTLDTHFTAQATSVVLSGTAGLTAFDALYPIRTGPNPTKMVAGADEVHLYGDDNWLYRHFFNLASQGDFAVAVVETPWLEVSGGVMCQLEAIELVCVGSWTVYYASNPKTNNLTKALQTAVVAYPNSNTTATQDLRRFTISGNGSHIKLRFESSDLVKQDSYTQISQPKLCSVAVVYKQSNQR